MIKSAKEHKELLCNPIYEWAERDIWDYVAENDVQMNPLYWMGYWRVGCIGCPMANRRQRIKEFNDFPSFQKAYTHAFDRMIAQRKAEGKKCDWATGEEVFEWWLGKDQIDGQMRLEFND